MLAFCWFVFLFRITSYNVCYTKLLRIPVFPDLYGVYKKGNWAFSLGVGPVAGGGTATFDNGLPSFEIPISKAVPALAGLSQISPDLAVTGYSLKMEIPINTTRPVKIFLFLRSYLLLILLKQGFVITSYSIHYTKLYE